MRIARPDRHISFERLWWIWIQFLDSRCKCTAQSLATAILLAGGIGNPSFAGENKELAINLGQPTCAWDSAWESHDILAEKDIEISDHAVTYAKIFVSPRGSDPLSIVFKYWAYPKVCYRKVDIPALRNSVQISRAYSGDFTSVQLSRAERRAFETVVRRCGRLAKSNKPLGWLLTNNDLFRLQDGTILSDPDLGFGCEQSTLNNSAAIDIAFNGHLLRIFIVLDTVVISDISK